MNLKTLALINIRARIASLLLPWISELVISGYLPVRIGRYLVLDTLISWSEDDATI